MHLRYRRWSVERKRENEREVSCEGEEGEVERRLT